MKYLLVILGLMTRVIAQDVKLVDPLEPVFPDSNKLSAYGPRYRADIPANGIAAVHVLVEAAPGERFTVQARFRGVVLPLADWSSLVAVPVEQNTGIEGHTEAFTDRVNPDVIRRAPFEVYEAIVPLAGEAVEGKRTAFARGVVTVDRRFTALRLAVAGAALGKAGVYRIAIEVAGKGWKKQCEMEVHVYGAVLPDLSNSHFFYTNWFNLTQMELKHGVKRWTPEWFVMLDKYATLMAAGRQNCISIPTELIAVKDGRITLEEEKMIRFVRLFRKHGFIWFEFPHLMMRGGNDDWHDPGLQVQITQHRYGTPESIRDVDTIVGLTKAFITKYGLVQNSFQHISDEPTDIQGASYQAVVRQVRHLFPGLKTMEATNDRDSLAGAVDCWCPLIDDFQEHETFFRGRQKMGERVLVYTCLIPGGKWLNREMDQERLRPVYFGWGAAYYGTFGYLHWGLNQYFSDPWKQSVVKNPSPRIPRPTNYLPAGDTHIIYPGAEGPLSSVRFEAQREGVEDYELLYLLRQKAAASVEPLIGQVFRNYTDYETSVPRYRAVKRKLLEME